MSTDMKFETKSSNPTKFLELGKKRQTDSFSVVSTESRRVFKECSEKVWWLHSHLIYCFIVVSYYCPASQE